MSKYKNNKVYFIQASNGLIKIGKSNNPRKRLALLQVGSPNKLRIVKLINGGMYIEQALHNYFKLYRLHGEWFQPSKPLLDFIYNKKLITIDDLIQANPRKNIVKYLKSIYREFV